KVYLLEDHELPTINGTALVRTGNLFDPPDQIGLATITGTLIRTGGTASRTSKQLDEQLENVAASVESSIGESSRSFAFLALKDKPAEVLEIFKDVLTNPEFREDKLELARDTMKGGIARRNDDAQSILSREFSDILYGRNNPYGWSEEYATVDRVTR